MLDDGGAAEIQLALQLLGPDFRVFLHEGAEQLDDGQAVQRFVAHRPGNDLPHALHFTEAREIQQDGEGREQLQAFGEGTERCQSLGNLVLAVDPEALHVVVFVLHLLVFEEGGVFDFRHADRIQQMAVGGDVHGFDVGEGGQHHQHFGGFKHLAVMLHVAVIHLDIGLGEEAEDLRQQVAFRRREVAVPVLHVVGERHFFRQPVHALLHQPCFIGPGIAERLVDRVGGQQVELHWGFIRRDCGRVHLGCLKQIKSFCFFFQKEALHFSGPFLKKRTKKLSSIGRRGIPRSPWCR